MTILCVGDSYMPVEDFRTIFGDSYCGMPVNYLQLAPAEHFAAGNMPIREFEGDPGEISGFTPSPEILVVHGAPVTSAVLDAHPKLRLLCCARGGPVNVDVRAATDRGIPVATSPGKNAAAVAELTLAFLIMLGRRAVDAASFLRAGNQLTSTFDGGRFLGRELSGLTLGLVGYGQVGRLVAARANALGVTVLAYDPCFSGPDPSNAVELLSLPELLQAVDVVSLHARATTNNRHMIDGRAFAMMRPGSMLINTARESLVDESALVESLRSGHLIGAALDVFEPTEPGDRSPLVDMHNVLLTPHIGGATQETLRRGSEIVAAEVTRFCRGETLLHLVDVPRVEPPSSGRIS
jgi:D-3-phosphoglycerate dehydrogenase / 2-oxoglutarate reductase